VKLYRLNSKGQCMVFTQIEPGTIFGFRGLFNLTLQRHFAEAVEASEISILTRNQVLTNLKEHPELIVRILELLCTRLSYVEEQLIGVAYSSSLVRLAYFLLENTYPESEVLSNFTHEEIGNRIGVVRQTVTENLNYLRKIGLIDIKPKQIQIINRLGLEEIIGNR
jgi:CRP/FNR family transcriptional regulator